jgi:crotonobetainyl-CoA:carnitine CoA-transferase CaiB-like acyl-CoA transferase
VDRVEAPGPGDLARHIPPFVDGAGAWFSAMHAGKRSICLDLRRREGRDLLRRLLAGYDVLVEGFRPGVLEAMELDPLALLASHPRLVIARLSGFGQTGPWAQRPGHDLNYVGLAGLLAGAALTPEGAPALPTSQVADLGGASLAAMAICAALTRVARGGPGAVLDLGLAEAALFFAAPSLLAATAEQRDLVPGQELLGGGLPVYGCYRCADGQLLTVGALEPKFQEAVRAQVAPLEGGALAAAFAQRPRDAWLEELAEACVAPALQPREVADFPQWIARDATRRLAGATWVRPPLGTWPEGGVPKVGEHSRVVLLEGGVSPQEITALEASGVVLGVG